MSGGSLPLSACIFRSNRTPSGCHGVPIPITVDSVRRTPTYLRSPWERYVFEVGGLPFPLRSRVHVELEGIEAGAGPHEIAIRFDDPAIGIAWPDVGGAFILSEKDRDAPTLAEATRVG